MEIVNFVASTGFIVVMFLLLVFAIMFILACFVTLFNDNADTGIPVGLAAFISYFFILLVVGYGGYLTLFTDYLSKT